MRSLAAVFVLTLGCTAEAHTVEPWLVWPPDGDRQLEGTVTIVARCTLPPDNFIILIHATFNRGAEIVEDDVNIHATFTVDDSNFDGEPHRIHSIVHVPREASFVPEETWWASVEPDQDPAIFTAIAIPYGPGHSPTPLSDFELTGTLQADLDPCPTGSLQIRAEGEALPYGPVEAFMPLSPRE